MRRQERLRDRVRDEASQRRIRSMVKREIAGQRRGRWKDRSKGLRGDMILGVVLYWAKWPEVLMIGCGHMWLKAVKRLNTSVQRMAMAVKFLKRGGFLVGCTQELVALSGAHTLGSKGFGNPISFDNAYFKILLEKPWLSSGD
ncbi:hypothetical protein RHGRI_020956 [Rhododendron griersonianum]|uniref:L-ascorbate peroxidase n=1 Tax=Rhododendron griersonianum TaxID=479676 RepID=A0AAV6JQN1_9ERIC|nr:hypothetical protein RHGRI_020956 [Rhododendron griersonianum]